MLKVASAQLFSARAWAHSEFGGARLADGRLRARLVKIAASFMAQPTSSIPQACGRWSETKAAYRFFANAAVGSPALLQPHLQQSIRRIAAQPVVLVAQDTTSLTYGPRAGLGLVGRHTAEGLWLHTSLAFTPVGCALGLVAVEHWVRDPRELGKAAQRHSRALADKESQRWLNSFLACVELSHHLPATTRLINLADREGDIHALFAAAAAHPQVGVLVRARHDRKSVEGRKLSEIFSSLEPAGCLAIQVPRRPGQPARQARLELRFAAVPIAAPARAKGPALGLWVIDAHEVSQVEGRAVIHWRLVTNQPVRDWKEAVEMIGHYRVRWQIEEYHRVLKSGCQTQARQLEESERLEKILMLDMIVAWRVLELSRLARAESLDPLEKHFGTDEIDVLRQLKAKPNGRDCGSLDLREAVRLVAQLGGFLARKHDGEPGAMTLWRGIERLAAITTGWALAKSCG
jgi:hypothetical protein